MTEAIRICFWVVIRYGGIIIGFEENRFIYTQPTNVTKLDLQTSYQLITKNE